MLGLRLAKSASVKIYLTLNVKIVIFAEIWSIATMFQSNIFLLKHFSQNADSTLESWDGVLSFDVSQPTMPIALVLC